MAEDAGGVAAPVLAGFLWSMWGMAPLMAARIALAIVIELYAVFVERKPLQEHQPVAESPALLKQSEATINGIKIVRDPKPRLS
jgi:hypothetical protein